MSQPPYNPDYPVSPYPPQPANVGVQQYQQGAQPPPYSSGPAPYPQQQYTGPPGGPGPYGPGPSGPGPYGPGPGPGPGPHSHCGAQGPYGTAAHHPAGHQPETVYVYEDRQRRQKNSDEDTCFAMMAGACAMCLCCSLLAD